MPAGPWPLLMVRPSMWEDGMHVIATSLEVAAGTRCWLIVVWRRQLGLGSWPHGRPSMKRWCGSEGIPLTSKERGVVSPQCILAWHLLLVVLSALQLLQNHHASEAWPPLFYNMFIRAKSVFVSWHFPPIITR